MGDAVAWLAGAVNRFSSDRGEDLKHYQRNISIIFVISFFFTTQSLKAEFKHSTAFLIISDISGHENLEL